MPLLCAAAVAAGGGPAGAAAAGGARAASGGGAAGAGIGIRGLVPGSLLVSESVYANDPGIVAGQTQLPPGCTTGCVTATADGSYPQVFNNALVDGSFGVTSRIFLSEMTPFGLPLGTMEVPGLVTSFSSKSELALNLYPDGRYLTFMGYVTEPDTVDVSNSNTPGVIDPTNPVPGAYYRAAAQLTADGRLDTTGKACPNGVGLPAAGAQLPTSPLGYDPATLQANGLPSNMCILKGFPTTLAKSTTNSFPFGLWFANPDTLYVADEGNGTNTFSGGQYTAAAQTTAGLQKWVFDGTQRKLAYTLQAGLGLGQPYTVRGYPTGVNAATGLPWTPGTDGLRNLTGRVNPNGTVTIWAITSTVSGGDQGADPNKLVEITDPLAAASPAPRDSFRTVRAASFGEVLRGVSFTPGSR